VDTQTSAATAPSQPYKKLTLRELGASLPIGTNDPATGKLVKSMAHRRWSLKTEKMLGKLRDTNRRETHARFASMVIGALYEQLGGVHIEFDEPNGKQHRAKSPWFQTLANLGQMWFGDMMYAYIYLRRECLSHELDMDLMCPNCQTKQPFTADLNSLEVRTVEKLEDCYWDYTLRDPFQVRGKACDVIKFGPSRWSAIESSDGSGQFDVGAAKSTIITSAIAEIAGHQEIIVVEGELEEMSKRDLEEIIAGLETHSVGPELAIESHCERCKNDFRTAFDWTYDAFFKASGRSEARRN
jgi:hypothetical protein